MTRTVLLLCMAAAMLAAKDRAWQTGVFLDKNSNAYFKTLSTSEVSASPSGNSSFVAGDNGVIAVGTRNSAGGVNYDNFVVQGPDNVYLVEYARFHGFPPPNISILKPVTFAVEKGRLYFLDLDKHEFETSILKQAERRGPVGTAVASTTPPPPAPVKTEPVKTEAPKPAPTPTITKAEQARLDQAKLDQAKAAEAARVQQAKLDQAKAAEAAKVQQAKLDQAKAAELKPASKNEDLFARSGEDKPKPAVPVKPVATQKPTPTGLDASVRDTNTKSDTKTADAPAVKPAPAPKAEPKVEAALTKPAPKPQPDAPAMRPEVKPAPKPEPKVEAAITKPAPARPEGPVVRASTKDRAWQAGNLLSVASNSFFFNVTYTSDQDGSAWPFSQGSDGRLTVTGQIAANTNSLYTYDNYVIESEFVAYLVQRMRPKTSPAVRLPGTKALKFAVDKGKMWVIDEQGIEYEFKVIKLIQKDAIVDPLTQKAAR